MNILLLDDDQVASIPLKEYFERRNHMVDWVKEIVDARYKIEFDPGLDTYDILIIDLTILGDGRLGGWIFVEEIISKYPESEGKIVLYSGRLHELSTEQKASYPKLRFLDKTKNTLHEDLNCMF